MVAYTFILALVAFLAASCNGAAVAPRISDLHNIDECDYSSPLVTPLLRTTVTEEAKFLRVLKKTITFKESPSQPKLIACVKVINMDPTDHGGYPTIIRGGVGDYDVQILLTSQRGHPLMFRIEIWAA